MFSVNTIANSFTFATDPLVTSDSSIGYKISHVWVNSVTKLAYICVDSSVGSAIWKDISVPLAHPLNFTFGTEVVSYLTANSSTYETRRSFFFLGSDNMGIPTKAHVYVATKGATTANIRIYDTTNANVIAETTLFSSSVNEVFEDLALSSFANIPTGSAIFELQVLISSTGGGRECRISALAIE